MDLRYKYINLKLNKKNIKFYHFDYEYYKNKKHRNYYEETGLDIISYCISKRNTWEKLETEILIEILKGGNKYFIDVGCHIGYFSIIANIYNNKVLSIDKNKIYTNVLQKTISNNNLKDISNILIKNIDLQNINQYELVIDNNPIDCLKISVNNNEILVLNMFMNLIKQNKIKYIFTIYRKNMTGYFFLIKLILNYGYKVYDIGIDKNNEKFQNNTNHLININKYEIIKDKLKDYLSTLKTSETILLFISQNLN